MAFRCSVIEISLLSERAFCPGGSVWFEVQVSRQCEASAYEVDHRDVDYGFGAVGVGLEVAGNAAVVHQPAEGPLNRPSTLHL